ncbi:hypothetical protein GN956_G13606 [Arapaima gigas]
MGSLSTNIWESAKDTQTNRGNLVARFILLHLSQRTNTVKMVEDETFLCFESESYTSDLEDHDYVPDASVPEVSTDMDLETTEFSDEEEIQVLLERLNSYWHLLV